MTSALTVKVSAIFSGRFIRFFAGTAAALLLAQPSAMAQNPNSDVFLPGGAAVIPPDFYGLNISHYGNRYFLSDRSGNPSSYYNPADVVAFIKELQPELIRIPGGTFGNFYFWDRQGYISTRSPDFRRYYGTSPTSIRIIANKPTSGLTPLSLSEMFVIQQQANLATAYILNVFKEDAASVVPLVKQLRTLSGNRPLYIELGNEVNNPVYADTFPTAQSYLGRSLAIARAIKQLDSSIGVGLVGVDPEIIDRMGNRPQPRRPNARNSQAAANRQRLQDWNNQLFAALGSTNDVDAVIFHYYNRQVGRPGTQDNPQAVMNALFDGLNEMEASYRAVIPRLGNKQIWMTEWGFMDRSAVGSEGGGLDIAKSPGVAVMLADLYGRILTLGRVTLAPYFTAYAANGFGLFQSERPRDQGALKRLPAFYTIGKFGELARRYSHWYALQTAGAAVGGYGFGTASQLCQVYFINRTASPRQASLGGGGLLSPTWSYSNNNPLPELGSSGNIADLPANIPTPRTVGDGQFRNAVNLPPYSMTVARVGSRSGPSCPN